MDEGSAGWKEVKTKMWARIKEIEKEVSKYDYSEMHHMASTDEAFKDTIIRELRKSKKVLFNIMEDAYCQQKEGMTADIQKIRDDVDILLDEIKIKHADKWPRSMPEEFLSKIVMHDSDMLKEIPKLNALVEEAHKHILKMEKPNTSMFDKQELDKLNRMMNDMKDMVARISVLFRERELLINLRHLRREQEYEQLRNGMETTY